MLRELHIENIAIIEKADIEFYNGFNVMTGETGAGKSIVIDSLNAVLGGRTTRELVRHGAERATVTAVFDSEGVESWLQENDIDVEDELIVQRKISAEGKSACRISGVPVSVAQLRELGGLLLNIHGQNDGRQLMDESSHLGYLDAYGNYEKEYARFKEAYEEYREIVRKINKLSMDEDEKRRMIESLEYRVAELSKANLEEGEYAQLEARAEIMRNAEKLSENLGMAFGALYDSELNAIGLISDAQYGIRRVLDYASDLADAPDALEQARLLLEDVAERLRDLLAELDFSPEEYDRIETRLAQLKKLERKFGTDEAGLIEMLKTSRDKLEQMQSSDDLIQLYEKQAEQARTKTRACAAELTKARERAGEELASRIQKELAYLSMPSVRFVTEIVPVESRDGFVSTASGFS
ncbi:MAG: AAA family ATPase [Oscillospiraceae bacterium]|nr:AAA family ATPase [Oscillospiraceae bacterium]